MTKNVQPPLSAACEDYLKAIYALRSEELERAVTTQALALRLNVAAPSATAMIKKLATLKLVAHSPYRGVELTEAGEKIALETIRHHRLVETYLVEILGVDWDKVHDEADRWEHILSEEVEAKMAAALGHPTRDPHGAPIPTLEGHVPRDSWVPLASACVGTKWNVRRISDESSEMLRHLRDLEIVPGAQLEVVRASPKKACCICVSRDTIEYSECCRHNRCSWKDKQRMKTIKWKMKLQSLGLFALLLVSAFLAGCNSSQKGATGGAQSGGAHSAAWHTRLGLEVFASGTNARSGHNGHDW
jgi:DtxR family Mn-dependent transcriptional regulator